MVKVNVTQSEYKRYLTHESTVTSDPSSRSPPRQPHPSAREGGAGGRQLTSQALSQVRDLAIRYAGAWPVRTSGRRSVLGALKAGDGRPRLARVLVDAAGRPAFRSSPADAAACAGKGLSGISRHCSMGPSGSEARDSGGETWPRRDPRRGRHALGPDRLPIDSGRGRTYAPC